MELDQLFSLPAHPLLVHIPVVLVPLAALGVVLLVLRPRWIRPYGPIVVAVALAGAIGAVLAAGSGEALEESMAAGASRALVHEHAEAGDLARALALVLLAAAVALLAVDWFGRRRAAVPAASTATATAAVAGGAVAPEPGTGGSALPKWLSIGVAVIAVAAAVGSVVAVVDAGHSGAKAVWHGTDVSSGDSYGDDGD